MHEKHEVCHPSATSSELNSLIVLQLKRSRFDDVTSELANHISLSVAHDISHLEEVKLYGRKNDDAQVTLRIRFAFDILNARHNEIRFS